MFNVKKFNLSSFAKFINEIIDFQKKASKFNNKMNIILPYYYKNELRYEFIDFTLYFLLDDNEKIKKLFEIVEQTQQQINFDGWLIEKKYVRKFKYLADKRYYNQFYRDVYLNNAKSRDYYKNLITGFLLYGNYEMKKNKIDGELIYDIDNFISYPMSNVNIAYIKDKKSKPMSLLNTMVTELYSDKWPILVSRIILLLSENAGDIQTGTTPVMCKIETILKNAGNIRRSGDHIILDTGSELKQIISDASNVVIDVVKFRKAIENRGDTGYTPSYSEPMDRYKDVLLLLDEEPYKYVKELFNTQWSLSNDRKMIIISKAWGFYLDEMLEYYGIWDINWFNIDPGKVPNEIQQKVQVCILKLVNEQVEKDRRKEELEKLDMKG